MTTDFEGYCNKYPASLTRLAGMYYTHAERRTQRSKVVYSYDDFRGTCNKYSACPVRRPAIVYSYPASLTRPSKVLYTSLGLSRLIE